MHAFHYTERRRTYRKIYDRYTLVHKILNQNFTESLSSLDFRSGTELAILCARRPACRKPSMTLPLARKLSNDPLNQEIASPPVSICVTSIRIMAGCQKDIVSSPHRR